MNEKITKNLIRESFIKLLKENKICDIKVSDIAKEANINRMTFYYHFKNIEDLIIYIANIDVESKFYNVLNWKDALINLLLYLKNDVYFQVKNIYLGLPKEYIETYLNAFIKKYILFLIDSNEIYKKIEINKKIKLIDYYKQFITSVILNYISSNYNIQIDQFVNDLEYYIEQPLKFLLENLSKQIK